MNFLKILSIFILSVLILTNISCSEKTEIKKSIPVPEKTIQSEKSVFVDPTKSMSNAELNEFDSLFNILYSNKLNAWKTKQENNLNCEIVFHTARDGHALCINFINFTDTSVLNMNLDTIIESISDNEFEQIEKPFNYIHTRRIMTCYEADKFELRFSGVAYQQYQFR